MSLPKPAKQAVASQGFAMAAHISNRMDERLAAIEREQRALREFFTSKRWLSLDLTITVAAETNSGEGFFEPIAQGYIFLPSRLTAQAPEGSKLLLFENHEGNQGFWEVVTNIQEYAEGIQGDQPIMGGTQILAQIKNAKKTGQAVLSLSGQLVPVGAGPHGRIP